MRVVVVACVVLALAACGGGSEAEAPSSGVAGTTLEGERVSLDQFRGRPVLVNVWSSW